MCGGLWWCFFFFFLSLVRECVLAAAGQRSRVYLRPARSIVFFFQPFLALFFIWLPGAHLAEIARCLRDCRALCVRTARQWRDSGLASLADMRRRDRLVSPAASHPYY